MLTPLSLKRLSKASFTSLLLWAAAGCGAAAPDEQPVVELPTAGEETWDAQEQASIGAADGAFLYTLETFGGNGRTCLTCHTTFTGTLSPSQAQAAFQRNRRGPLFRLIDSDDGQTHTYTKLLNDATVVVDVPLAPNVRLANTPAQRTFFVRRSIPTTFDTPALDPVLMWDGRAPTLTAQAQGAILGHAQAPRTPTASQLANIASFEQLLFSSRKMWDYARGGPAPGIPTGTSEAEKRGRAVWDLICSGCHNGALLNETVVPNLGNLPAGSRFANVRVSEFNTMGNPVHEFIVTLPDGTERRVSSPDPGRMLVTGRIEDLNFFKMMPLRNLKNTAPYFHDSSAKTLPDVAQHYSNVLASFGGPPLSPQQQSDLVAFLNLL